MKKLLSFAVLAVSMSLSSLSIAALPKLSVHVFTPDFAKMAARYLDIENMYCTDGHNGGCDGGVHDHSHFPIMPLAFQTFTRGRKATEDALPYYQTHLSLRKNDADRTTWIDCNGLPITLTVTNAYVFYDVPKKTCTILSVS